MSNTQKKVYIMDSDVASAIHDQEQLPLVRDLSNSTFKELSSIVLTLQEFENFFNMGDINRADYIRII